jgi:hypothetical protein
MGARGLSPCRALRKAAGFRYRAGQREPAHRAIAAPSLT